MQDAGVAGAVVGAVAGFLLLAFLQVPLTNIGPACSLKLWTKIIRCFKRGDRRPWTWSTIEEGVLYISSLPHALSDLDDMRRDPHNLRSVLSVNEPWELKISQEDYAGAGIEFRSLSVPDYSAPKLTTIIEAVRWMHEQKTKGGAVLVHCNAGRGRSVVVAIGYLLVLKEGWSSADGFEHVSCRRAVANLRAICDMRPQWRSLRKFERWLSQQKDAGWLEGTGKFRPPAQFAAAAVLPADESPTANEGVSYVAPGTSHVVDISITASPVVPPAAASTLGKPGEATPPAAAQVPGAADSYLPGMPQRHEDA